MPNQALPSSPAEVRRLILNGRGENESRLAHSVRLGIPESSLRSAEKTGRLPRNPTIRTAFLKALGVRS